MEDEASAILNGFGQTLNQLKLPEFKTQLKTHGLSPLTPTNIEILQINVGKLCNNCCNHCHVDAGPSRDEIMSKKILEYCLEAAKNPSINTIDITGGAPEMNPNFKWFIEELQKFGKKLIVRTNLTVLKIPEYEDVIKLYKENKVSLIASMPCYTQENVDAQRGDGVYDKSVEILKQLNQEGYGMGNLGLDLNLVYNPGGAALPGPQESLEEDYKRELKDRHGVSFNHLFTITNIPIGRYLKFLFETNLYEDYMKLLIDSFNPDAALGVMCRNTISVDWNGYLYDCDFNQMLDLKIEDNRGNPIHIKDFNHDLMLGRNIIFKNHCYGCTAGAGSSCQGAIL